MEICGRLRGKERTEGTPQHEGIEAMSPRGGGGRFKHCRVGMGAIQNSIIFCSEELGDISHDPYAADNRPPIQFNRLSPKEESKRRERMIVCCT